MSGVEGRVALVTGASGAIGGAIARRLARGGAHVAVHYHGSEEKARAAVGAVEDLGQEALAVRADLTVAAEVDAIVGKIMEKWGRLEILVNNAGVNRDTLLMRMDEADWDVVIQANLKSAYLCSRAVVRAMMRQRYGRVVNMTSVVGITGNAGQANYAAAKAGLIGLTRSLARELATRGVTANALAPGFIDAGMTVGLTEELRVKATGLIPVARFGTVEEVAEAALFLCTEEAGYITGQVLQVDGGMVMG